MAARKKPAKKAARKTAKKAAKKAAMKTAGGAAKKAAPTADTPILSLGDSPCAARGPENPAPVRAHRSDQLHLFFQVCASPADLIVRVREVGSPMGSEVVLFEGRIPPQPNPVVLPVVLEPGIYVVQWGYGVPEGAPWQAVAEVQVNGAAMFRKLNEHDDDRPYFSIWTYVQVIQP